MLKLRVPFLLPIILAVARGWIQPKMVKTLLPGLKPMTLGFSHLNPAVLSPFHPSRCRQAPRETTRFSQRAPGKKGPSYGAGVAGPTVSAVSENKASRFKLYYNDIYRVDLPPGHRFPMEKYRMVRERIQNAGNLSSNIDLAPSPLVSLEDLITTHCPRYVDRFLNNQLTDQENRNIGFPWSTESVDRALSSVGGTVAATHAVCNEGYQFAGHVAGGTHHAFYDRGEGFCTFSDIAVAANVVLRDYPLDIDRILIFDCDVHQGNGNAVLFEHDPRVTTFSMHCEQNLFSAKRHSDVDEELPAGCGDEVYLQRLDKWLSLLFSAFQPQLTFYQAGVDPLSSDKLGRLDLSVEGLRARDEAVFATALEYGSKLVVTMGGGYPKNLSVDSKEFEEVVAAHTQVYLGAAAAISRDTN